MVRQAVPLSQIVSNGCFVKPLPFIEELSDILWGVTQQLVLHQERDTLRAQQQELVGYNTHVSEHTTIHLLRF